MCGITGFVNFDNVNNYQNVLKEMANSIEFRGPGIIDYQELI